jgi:cytochrome c oxidase cbb3-type subunit 2
MSFRTFICCLFISFGAAWFSVVVYPFFQMRNIAPLEFNEATDGVTGVFIPKRSGRVADGARVYAENGCYACHTQMIRPTYAGKDMFREDWAGLAQDAVRGDTRRETNFYDFEGESFAQLGMTRLGPDLSNVGRRMETTQKYGLSVEDFLFKRLYQPVLANPELWNSVCPSHAFLFDAIDLTNGLSRNAILDPKLPGKQLVPNADAKALVSYLAALKKDHKVPSVLNFTPKQSEKK